TRPWGARFVLLAVGAALVWWGYSVVQDHRRWSAYLEKLKAEPGVVVIASEKQHGKRFIRGLRDPLAADPAALLQEVGIDPAEVTSHWEPYQALQPQFILTRAKTILSPPDGISLSFEDGTLTATGSAPRQWAEDAQKLARAIPGVTNFFASTSQEANAGEADPSTSARQLQRKELA